MKRKELKIGDQVKFFGAAVSCQPFTGLVISQNRNSPFVELVDVIENKDLYFMYEEKIYTIDRRQVYKVRRKKQRKEFWIRNTIVGKNHLSFNGELVVEIRYSDPCDNEWTLVREVK